AQALALHGDGEASAEATGQGREDERVVEVGDVVRDEERLTTQAPQILSAAHAHPAEQRSDRQDDGVEEYEAEPGRGEALRPSGVRVLRRRLGVAPALNDALD